MPGKNRIVLNGWGRIGRAQVNAVLSSGADCLGLREATDVPPIEVKKCCEPPVVLIAKDQCDVLGPERIRNLEQKYGIQLVGTDVQMPFPKDELLEMKDKIYDIAHTIPKPIIPDDIKNEVRHRKSRTDIKKKKAKRRQQKQARRNSRK